MGKEICELTALTISIVIHGKRKKLASAVRGKAKGDRNIVARQDKGLRAAERDYLLLSVWRLPL